MLVWLLSTVSLVAPTVLTRYHVVVGPLGLKPTSQLALMSAVGSTIVAVTLSVLGGAPGTIWPPTIFETFALPTSYPATGVCGTTVFTSKFDSLTLFGETPPVAYAVTAK